MTGTFEVFGELEWVKAFEHNRDMKGPPGAGWAEKGGMYTADIYMDDENAQILRDSGTASKIEKMDDGRWKFRFKRPHNHKYPQYGGPPQVVNADNTPWDEGLGDVGNGSKGYVMFVTYETSLSNGTRMEGIQVTEPQYFASAPRFQDRSGESAPAPKAFTPKTPTTKPVPASAVPDDEIPF